jgi:hypothetical protein
VRQVGWRGAVTACQARPGGGWVITASVRPWLVAKGLRHSYVLDSVEETYEFVAGRVRLLESDATTAKPRLQAFPPAF